MGASAFQKLKDEYRSLWQGMTIHPSKVPVIDRIARKLIAAKLRYRSVADQTGVPWAAIALIHQMECGGDWRLSIAQGDPWNKVSTHVPKGRGPFDSWEAAAIDALSIDGTDRHGTSSGCATSWRSTTASARAAKASTRLISGAPATTTPAANTSPIMCGTATR